MNDANFLRSMTYTKKARQPFKIAYDSNYQLTKETLPDGTMNTYKYDEVGNRTASEVNGEKATFTYNDANQIATKNETTYTYDKDGNLLQDEHYKRKVSQYTSGR
ncbi:RHS repeat domain-containing protein [Kurthia sibirica]|nr:RHS repeat domain-containing protein [Kurthia sibirica]